MNESMHGTNERAKRHNGERKHSHRRQYETLVRHNWEGKSLCYLESTKHSAFIRICIRFPDREKEERKWDWGLQIDGPTSGDSSSRINAPLVSTWIAFAVGNDGPEEDDGADDPD